MDRIHGGVTRGVCRDPSVLTGNARRLAGFADALPFLASPLERFALLVAHLPRFLGDTSELLGFNDFGLSLPTLSVFSHVLTRRRFWGFWTVGMRRHWFLFAS